MSDPVHVETSTEITLVIPATNDHIRFARLMASAVGARLGFDYDMLEDLRLAVSELCTSVSEAASIGGELTLTYRGTANELQITGHSALAPGSSAPGPPGELTLQILDAVAGEHTFEASATAVRFTLLLRPVPSPAT